MDHFKVFIQFVTVLLLFYTLVFWQWGMWSLSSPLRNQTHIPCTRRRRPATELPGKSQDPHYGSFSPTTLGLVMFTPTVPAYLQLHERFFSFTHACPVLPCIHLIGSYWSWRLNLDKKAPWDPWGGRRTFLRGFSPRFIKLPTSWSLSPTVFFPKSRDVCFTFQKPTLSLLSIKRLLNQLCKVIPKFWDHFQVQQVNKAGRAGKKPHNLSFTWHDWGGLRLWQLCWGGGQQEGCGGEWQLEGEEKSRVQAGTVDLRLGILFWIQKEMSRLSWSRR